MEPSAMSYQRERAWESRRSLDARPQKLTGPLVARARSLQCGRAGRRHPSSKRRPVIIRHRSTSWMWRTCSRCMACARLGFACFSDSSPRLPPLCAAVFLAMLYLSMPPWPGLPPNPRAEGHYWIVSKNLVELIACMVVATTASGHWFGLDALFFGGRRRRRWAAREQARGKYGLTARTAMVCQCIRGPRSMIADPILDPYIPMELRSQT